MRRSRRGRAPPRARRCVRPGTRRSARGRRRRPPRPGSLVSVFEPPSRIAAVGRRPAHDGRADPQRAVLERDGAVRDARAVAVDVRARAHLGHLGHLVVGEERRRAAGADASRPRGPRLDRVDRGAQPRAGARAGSGRSSGRRSAGPAASRRARRARRPPRASARPCARSPCRTRRGSRPPPPRARAPARVRARPQPSRRPPTRVASPASAASRSALAAPRSGNVSRMSRSPAASITSASPSFWQVIPTAPARTCMCAIAGQLVRLDVRPEGEAVLVAVALHARDVALDGVQVDGRDRRVERVESITSRRARRPRRPRRRSRRGRTGSSSAPASDRRRNAGTRRPSRRSASCR